MAETATIVESGVSFTANFDEQSINIGEITPGDDDQLTGDVLRRALRRLGATDIGMQFDDPIPDRVEGRFAYTSDGSVSGFLEFSLGGNWFIRALKTSGIFRLVGANVIQPNRPDIFADDTPAVSYKQFSVSGGTASILETGVSGLTPTESAQLAASAAATPAATAAAVWEGAALEAGLSAGDLLRIISAVLAGAAVVPSADGTYSFTGLDGTTVRVGGTMAGSVRAPTVIDGDP